MSLPSRSRQSSFSYTETPSRRSSTNSNPDVFSDDYALEPIDSRLDLNLHNSISLHDTAPENDRAYEIQSIAPYPAIPARLSVVNRPNSIAKRPPVSDTASVSHDGATLRTLSTSSRFSFFRPQSPYSGPTQPSHPYAMYPQITRASSIASSSTVRQPENPFIPTGGPEHPYSQHAQNVPEDDGDDNDIGSQPIPLGFPRLGLGGQRVGRGGPGSDVGDIVGSDGHIEQLPPYTRYADNVVAKGDMADISDGSTLRSSRRPSGRSTLIVTDTNSDTVVASGTDERGILLNEETRKESWKDKAQRKVCGGLALWLMGAIVVMVVLAGVLGGVIGGYVGRHQTQSSATATVWMDSDPAYTTNQDIPACPTGKYTIPFKKTQDINSCIVGNAFMGRPWGCLELSFLGITISDSIVAGNKTLQVKFEDYSVNTSSFLYGPQPPDFNGTTFDLTPSKDKTREELGVAMFFYRTFDKLSILPQLAIKPNRRSVSERELFQRNAGPRPGDPLAIGHQPWFCFWNSTISEFWIFLQQPANPESWNSTSMITSSQTLAPTAPPPPPPPSSATTAAATQSLPSNINPPGPTPSIQKRDTYLTPYYPQYPQLVKMVDKRKAKGNIQPYCQQMLVMPDWNIVPNPNQNLVTIQEYSYNDNPMSMGVPDRRRNTVTQEYDSNCVCEWQSI